MHAFNDELLLMTYGDCLALCGYPTGTAGAVTFESPSLNAMPVSFRNVTYHFLLCRHQ